MSHVASNSAPLVWQGWRMDLPSRWNPVKIEGDYDAGYLLLADLHGPRLGIRWKRTGRKFDPAKWAKSAIRAEAGEDAASEARQTPVPGFDGSTIFIDTESPGRDVWVGHSPVSNRAIEVVYRARRREHVLAGIVLPTLKDNPPKEPMPWAIFSLSCIVPEVLPLLKHQFNAGDLSMSFQSKKAELHVRQVALAEQALARMPLEKWLNQQEWPRRKHYRRYFDPDPTNLAVGNRTLEGLLGTVGRRRRFALAWWHPRALYTYVMQDKQRNRLIFSQSNDLQMAEAVLGTIGWAEAEV